MKFNVRSIKNLIFTLLITEIIFAAIIFSVGNFIDIQILYTQFPFIKDFDRDDWILAFTLMEFFIVIVIFSLFIFRNMKTGSEIKDIISKPESEKLEFKSSLRWDTKELKVNKDLENVIAKIVVGFLNTLGGTLVIGISDDKKVVGIEDDMNSLPKKNTDAFILHLTQILNQKIGINYSRYIKIRIIKYKGKQLCKVDVFAAEQPAYLKSDDNDQFYIRVAALTQPLKLSEAVEYIEMHWS